MSRVVLILILCCILVCNGQHNTIVTTGSGASPIDSDSDFNCYVGVKISSNFYNQDLQTVQPCNDNLNCVSLTANFEQRNLGISVRGEVRLGQCIPSTACSNLSCDSLRQQLATLNPSLSDQIDCTSSCCNTNLCNGPSESQTPSTDSMSSEIDNAHEALTGIGNRQFDRTRCYTGSITEIGTFVQNQQNITLCERGSICLGVTGEIDGSSLGISFSGNVSYGQCVPRRICPYVTCDSIREQLVGLSLVRVNIEDCETSCCDTDLCNNPTDEAASPRNQIVTDGNTSTSVGQAVTEAMTSQVVTGNVSPQSSGNTSSTSTTTTSGLCRSIVNLTAERQQISSPNYPANYPNRQICLITLRPSTPQSIVHIRFLVFRTERPFDYVRIYHNAASRSRRSQRSGSYPNNSLSFNLTGEARLYFYSNRFGNDQGFLADVYETRIFEPTTITSSENACGSTIRVTTERQLISSPNYPRNYPNRITCNLILQPSTQESVIRIEFLRFDTERFFDYITFLQNSRPGLRYSGSRTPFNITRTGTVTLRFISDRTRSKKGYLARIYEVSAGSNNGQTSGQVSTTTTTATSSVPRSCGAIINLSAERQQISSPNYPSNYPNRQTCDIILRPSTPRSNVHIRFLVFRTERVFDYVQIYNNLISGRQIYSGSFANNSLSLNLTGEVTVRFRSDRSLNSKGFLADVYETTIFEPTSITSSENVCGSTIRVTTERQLISSPNYPRNYPNNIFCTLILQPSTQESVIRIEFLRFDTERRWDYLQISQTSQPNVTYTGSRAPFNITGTGTVTLRFVSDRSVNKEGYLARIYES